MTDSPVFFPAPGPQRTQYAALLTQRDTLVRRLGYLAAIIVAHAVLFAVCLDTGHPRVALLCGAFVVLGVLLCYAGLAGIERVDRYLYRLLDDSDDVARQVQEGKA